MSAEVFYEFFNLIDDNDDNINKVIIIQKIYNDIFSKKYNEFIEQKKENDENDENTEDPYYNISKLNINISDISVDKIEENIPELFDEYKSISFINFRKYIQYFLADIILKIKKKQGLNDTNLENELLPIKGILTTEKVLGGNRKINKVKRMAKKTILGKERCIYKKPGDRKEYLKHKGELITVKDYKKLMKDKK
jgi:hypothetical protein